MDSAVKTLEETLGNHGINVERIVEIDIFDATSIISNLFNFYGERYSGKIVFSGSVWAVRPSKINTNQIDGDLFVVEYNQENKSLDIYQLDDKERMIRTYRDEFCHFCIPDGIFDENDVADEFAWNNIILKFIDLYVTSWTPWLIKISKQPETRIFYIGDEKVRETTKPQRVGTKIEKSEAGELSIDEMFLDDKFWDGISKTTGIAFTPSLNIDECRFYFNYFCEETGIQMTCTTEQETYSISLNFPEKKTAVELARIVKGYSFSKYFVGLQQQEGCIKSDGYRLRVEIPKDLGNELVKYINMNIVKK